MTLVFGQTQADADNIDAAYRRFHAQNVGIDDVLASRERRHALAAHPSDADLDVVTGCLK